MDVVYNHTGNQERLHFKLLGRSYYYRFGDDGALRNRAGTGNELATERPMVRKLIIDSLRHFVNEYRVDGFRLDLGALLDKRTLLVIDRALPRRVFLTAEPWSYEPGMWGKGDDDVARTRLTLWNDDYRNHVGDFVTGTGDPGRARAAILGGVYPSGWVKRPEDLQGARWRHQSMNYLESHDELKIADRVGHDVGRAGMAILLLAASQGPFMLGHRQETLQGKDGLHNTWQVPSPVSWENTPERERLFAFTSALVAIHKAFPHFRFPRPLAAPDHEVLETANEHALGFLLRPPRAAPGRKGLPDFLVLANGDTRPRDQAFAWEHFKLPPGTWRVVADSDTTRALDPDAIKQGAALHTAEGNYSVAPGRAVILALGR
jgi:pullulanase